MSSAHALAQAWGRRGREQASLHFSHFFLDEAWDLRNGDSEAGTKALVASGVSREGGLHLTPGVSAREAEGETSEFSM